MKNKWPTTTSSSAFTRGSLGRNFKRFSSIFVAFRGVFIVKKASEGCINSEREVSNFGQTSIEPKTVELKAAENPRDKMVLIHEARLGLQPK